METRYRICEDAKSFLGITAQECYIRAITRDDWDAPHADISDPYELRLGNNDNLYNDEFDSREEAQEACSYVGWSQSKEIKGYAAINFTTQRLSNIKSEIGYCIVPPSAVNLEAAVPKEFEYADALSPLRLQTDVAPSKGGYIQPVYGGVVIKNIAKAAEEFKNRLHTYCCPMVLATVERTDKGVLKADMPILLGYPTLAAYNEQPFIASNLYPVYEFTYYFGYIDSSYDYDPEEEAMADYYDRLADEKRERSAGIW